MGALACEIARRGVTPSPQAVGVLRRIKPLAAALFLLAGCANQQTPQQLMNKIASISQADLQAAQEDAMRHNDVLAMECYPKLQQWIIQLNAQRPQPPIGAFSAFQAARDGYKDVTGGVPTYVKIGCAAMYVDVQSDVKNIIALIAQIAATGTFPIPPLLP